MRARAQGLQQHLEVGRTVRLGAGGGSATWRAARAASSRRCWCSCSSMCRARASESRTAGLGRVFVLTDKPRAMGGVDQPLVGGGVTMSDLSRPGWQSRARPPSSPPGCTDHHAELLQFYRGRCGGAGHQRAGLRFVVATTLAGVVALAVVVPCVSGVALRDRMVEKPRNPRRSAARLGRPLIRRCSPTPIIRGRSAPSSRRSSRTRARPPRDG